MTQGRQTHLYDFHIRYGRVIPFANFQLPIWFKGIREEHMAVRTSAGLFDVSHMGRFQVTGSDATKFLQYLLPRDIVRIPIGRAFYYVICNDNGGILDDGITLRLGSDDYLMVVNAANVGRDYTWLLRHSQNYDVEVKDISGDTALLALQGPKSEVILQGIVNTSLSSHRRFTHALVKIDGVDTIVSRTGYTGEDGFEIFVLNCPVDSPSKARRVWDRILGVGGIDVLPCGLGARDTLRLEAGMCLHGSDIDETITPLEADLGWTVSFDKDEFVGKDALLSQRSEGLSRIRAGFIMKGRGIPRRDFQILKDCVVLGSITSGTFSPLLKKGVAMGYIPINYNVEGGEVLISGRGKMHDAVLKIPPFYETQAYGWKRVR